MLNQLGDNNRVGIVLHHAQNEHAIVAHVVLTEHLDHELLLFGERFGLECANMVQHELEAIVGAEEEHSLEPVE